METTNINKINKKMGKTKSNIEKIHSEMKRSSELNVDDFNDLLKRYKKEVKDYDKYFEQFVQLIDYIDNTF